MGNWKYPQLLILAVGTALAVLFCIDVRRSPESVEVYRGGFGPWCLRLAARERAAPGETLVLTAWISSPCAHPNFRRLQVSVAASSEPQPANMFGTGLARSGRLRLPSSAGSDTQILLRAELWDGTAVTKKIPAAPVLEGAGPHARRIPEVGTCASSC